MATPRTSQVLGSTCPQHRPGDETGDEGGVTPSSENSLHFKMILMPQGSAARASTLSISNFVPRQTSSPDSWTPTSDNHLQANSSINYEKSYNASRSLRWWFRLDAHFDVVCRLAVDDTQRSTLSPFNLAWNDLASTTNLIFPSDDRRVNGHRPSLSIGAAASPLTPGSLIEAYSTTHGCQRKGMRANQSPIHDIC